MNVPSGGPVFTSLDTTLYLAQSGGTDAASLLLTGSPYVLIVGGLLAVVSGKVRLEREVTERDKRIGDLIEAYEKRLVAADNNATEWKLHAFKAIGIGEKVATVVEDRGS